MKIDTSKPLTDFTDDRLSAYKLCLRATSRQPVTKNRLVGLIRKKGIYQREQDARLSLKMFLKNPNCGLKKQPNSEKVRNVVLNG
ncbi:hypothetical protein [Candidatus Nanohalococcus occultus]|uniref:hypothetical protein n=1 Tax=Candidatus Nanohalococcus occultus TaxID=2978047 RepID=UPI0039E011BA